ncbi:hypothetical protein [Listeria aquatica]|uniref:Helix-turn-helix domain-containing protein n=1 Tax=Listeria aquatica FSL S10-1188 TaxID=1265818 RepID=W7ASD9_9LIST|nr:hypothetical protein [Listeria aquatica]EUJ16522.1 hypothetical protein MAQA_16066 [Listeria aquatica FSL S10-1188]
MSNLNPKSVQDFMYKNLVSKNEARKITGQSYEAFSQSVKNGWILPFFESGSGTRKVRLYLKSDLEEYRNNKRQR